MLDTSVVLMLLLAGHQMKGMNRSGTTPLFGSRKCFSNRQVSNLEAALRMRYSATDYEFLANKAEVQTAMPEVRLAALPTTSGQR